MSTSATAFSRLMRHPNVYGILLTFACFFLILLITPTTIESSETNKRVVRSVVEAENNTKYGVICDAGSSGTRLFVYTLRPINDGLIDIDTLIHEGVPIVKKLTPGLSTFADNPEQVLEYITPLIKFAEEHLPAHQLAETDLFIFATAGMRLLPEEKKNSIIQNLQTGLKSISSLRVTDNNIRVIDGAWEGIYSWIAVNYALGRFNEKSPSRVGMLDMGGASVQIAFEVPEEENSYSGGNVYEINLGGNNLDDSLKFKLYSATFLGYGANEGLKKYEQSLLLSNTTKDSCSPKGMNKMIGELQVTGTGEWNTCQQHVSTLIGGSSQTSCPHATCFLHSVAAPSVNLSNIQLYGFSEYWYTLSNFGAGGEYHYQTFTDKVRKYCEQNWNDIQEGYKRNEFPNAVFERLGTNCFKAAWLTAMLHEGFNVDKTKNIFHSVLKIAGEEIQWALGAMLYHSRDLKFDIKEQSEVIHSHQQLSNFILLCVVMILVLSAVFYSQFQQNVRKFNYLRTDSKPGFLCV